MFLHFVKPRETILQLGTLNRDFGNSLSEVILDVAHGSLWNYPPLAHPNPVVCLSANQYVPTSVEIL
jgi:hypothetical protein